MKKLPFFALVLSAGLLLFQSSSQVVRASPILGDGAYVVNTTDLRVDPGNACDRHCSLAEAILQANSHRGPDTISFNIPGTAPFYINVGTGVEIEMSLPALTDWYTTIDGTTQPGYAGTPLIFLDGNGAVDLGLTINITAEHNVIRGLGFIGFSRTLPEGFSTNNAAIRMYGAYNVIELNYFGFDPYAGGGGSGNLVGITSYASNTIRDNVISGNDTGIYTRRGHNEIYRNKIGTDPTGTYAIWNEVGINTQGDTEIGLEEPGTGNLISGNSVGVVIGGYADRLFGNKIGTDISGTYGIPNEDGIWILNDISQQTVIGPWPTCCAGAEGNLIAHNTQYGIWLACAQETYMWGNTIAQNGSHGIELSSGAVCQTLHVRMLMNSIYDNGGLGIHFDFPDLVNEGIDPPVITEVRGVDLHGTACPGCQVELFIAAPDPSGFGEGKEHLSAVYANLDGNVFTTVPRLGPCGQITATATDDMGNTSEFAENYHTGICIRIPPSFILIWFIPFFGAGAGTAALLGPRRTRGWLRAAVGGVIGIAIGFGFLFLPFVQVLSPASPPGEGPEPLIPPCNQFISSAGLSPANNAVYLPGDNPIFELSPQPDPPGLVRRWFLSVAGPEETSGFLALSAGTTVTLSELGLDPFVEGTYYWTISAEQREADSEQWQKLCADPTPRQFSITSSEQGGTPMAVPTAVVNCRSGPTTEYPLLSILQGGQQLEIRGRSISGDAWLVFDPAIGATCWVAADLVEVSGDTSGVGNVIPDLPPPPVTEEPTAVDCSQWSGDQQACFANPACEWQPNLYPSDPCRNK